MIIINSKNTREGDNHDQDHKKMWQPQYKTQKKAMTKSKNIKKWKLLSWKNNEYQL
jgi:hypothetical protein